MLPPMPTAIPALPDTERRSTYAGVVNSTGPFNVGFAIYGDGIDYAQWVEVYDDGVLLTQGVDWTMDSPTVAFNIAARPITDARITFTAQRSGTIDIVGARRPRRISQLNENKGVSAHDFNQIVTDLTAALREAWDERRRLVRLAPGETQPILRKADIANKYLKGDAQGNIVPGSTATDIEGQVAAAAAQAAIAAGHAASALNSANAADADRVQTGLDRTQTGLDKVATAADRVQTGLDVTASAASAALAAANSENPAFTYKWSTDTGATDPTATFIKGNNAALGAINAVRISETSLEGPIGGFITAMMGSTSPVKATLIIIKPTAKTNYLVVDVTAHSDDGAWRTLTATVTASNGAFANNDMLSVHIVRTGNQGAGDLTAALNLSDLASPKTGRDNISIKGNDVVAAATIDLDAATGYLIDVTGSTQIDAVTLAAGRERWARFTGTPQLTNGAPLVISGGTRVMVAGDFVHFKGYAAGVVRATVFPGSGKAAIPHTPTEVGAAALAGNQNLTGGFSATSFSGGAQGTGTYTPNPANGNFQHITVSASAALTIAPPANACTILLQVENSGLVTSFTTSGFTKVTGSFTLTSGNKFHCFITKSNNYSSLAIVALQ